MRTEWSCALHVPWVRRGYAYCLLEDDISFVQGLYQNDDSMIEFPQRLEHTYTHLVWADNLWVLAANREDLDALLGDLTRLIYDVGMC